MAPFTKIPFLVVQPTTNTQRLHSQSSMVSGGQVAGRRVLPNITQYPLSRLTRNEHILAILAHTRSIPGQGCQRVTCRNTCQFQDTIVYLRVNLNTGARLMVKCTNCHFAIDRAAYGAILTTGNVLPPPPPLAPPIPAIVSPVPVLPLLIQRHVTRQAIGISSTIASPSRPS